MYRGGPYLEESVIGGSTVVRKFGRELKLAVCLHSAKLKPAKISF